MASIIASCVVIKPSIIRSIFREKDSAKLKKSQAFLGVLCYALPMTKVDVLPFSDFAALPVDQAYQRLCDSEDKVQNLQQTIEILNQKLQLMRHQQFGRKSEKIDGQQELNFPEVDRAFDESPELKVSDAQETQTSEKKESRAKPGRRPLPEHLPRQRLVHDLNDAEKVCPCGQALTKIGEETSEQLDYIPAQVKVIQHVRNKYACKCCENMVKTAPPPALPIPKSIASPGLLTQVIVSKYDDHLPLYRQAEMWQRLGIDLSRANLSNWMIQVGELLSPLVCLLKQEIVRDAYVRADETPTQVLKQAQPNTSDRAYMWVYMAGRKVNPSIVYEYQPSRKGEHAKAFLTGFQGYLQTDGYKGYTCVTEQPGITAVGCWAHARRKFHEVALLAPKTPGKASEALLTIKKLYQLEQHARDQELPPGKIKELRQEKAKPILDQFKSWLDQLKAKVLPKGPLGKAIAYALNHWPQLTAYLDDGRIDIDNNACERAIRPFAVGRKNWLFMGNDKGAEAGACLYSLIETAKANGLDSYQYLRHVLTTLPTLTPEQYSSLLPWNCKDAVAAATPKAP